MHIYMSKAVCTTEGNMSLILSLCFSLLFWSHVHISEGQYTGSEAFYTFYNDAVAPAAGKLDRKLPTGAMAPLLQYPELVLEPNLEDDNGYITFFKSKPETYEKYIARLDEVLKPYSNPFMATADVMDCGSTIGYRHPDEWNSACRVDLSYYFGQSLCTREQGYGYEDGWPCIFLFLDRIYNWVPEPYTNETVPDGIRHSWSPDAVTVKCGGTDPSSVDNLVDVKVHPSSGFHVKYFPFTGHSPLLRPVVAVQFLATAAVAIEVKCTAWARNTMHRDLIQTGSVTFQIAIE